MAAAKGPRESQSQEPNNRLADVSKQLWVNTRRNHHSQCTASSCTLCINYFSNQCHAEHCIAIVAMGPASRTTVCRCGAAVPLQAIHTSSWPAHAVTHFCFVVPPGVLALAASSSLGQLQPTTWSSSCQVRLTRYGYCHWQSSFRCAGVWPSRRSIPPSCRCMVYDCNPAVTPCVCVCLVRLQASLQLLVRPAAFQQLQHIGSLASLSKLHVTASAALGGDAQVRVHADRAP